MSARRRGTSQVEGHAYVGWELAKPLSDEDRERVEALRARTRLDARDDIDERVRSITGPIVPVCECGWTGWEEPWQPPAARSRRGGQQHIAHRHMARMDALELEHAADVAAALRHAAQGWEGDDEVAHWLEARAEHVEQVGR